LLPSGHFNFNLDDLADGKSITSKIKSSFYPENQQLIKGTSASMDGEVGRTLMSRDPVKIIQGDGIFRNPAFPVAGYEQNTKSAMHTILSMGADIDDQTQVPDPDDPTKTLKGSQARMEIARKSVMSTGFAPGGFDQAVKAFIAPSISPATGGSSTTGGTGGTSSGTGTVTTSTGASQPHSTASYGTSGTAQVMNNATRKVNGVTTAKAKANPQNLGSLGFDIHHSGYYVEKNGTYKYMEDKITGLGTGEKQVMMSPTLIEFLLRITDTLYIMGDSGVWRGITGPNFSKLTQSNNGVSDHSFGRGFDIKKIGLTTANQSYVLNNPVPPPGKYLIALDLFLSHVEQLPQELHPDLIVVSEQLETELGIVGGLESSNSPIRQKHPNLAPFVNIHCDKSHANHIHVSWSSARCGSFAVPTTTTPSTPGQSGSGTVSSAGAAPAPATPLSSDMITKLKKEYYTGDDALTAMDIFSFLYNYGGFSAEIAAFFTGIAQRESNFTPFVNNKERRFWSLAVCNKNISWRNWRSKNSFSNTRKNKVVEIRKRAELVDNITIEELLLL